MSGRCDLCNTVDLSGGNFHRCREHFACDCCGAGQGSKPLCSYGRAEGVFCEGCWRARMDERIALFCGDTESTREPVCPWCGHGMSDWIDLQDGTRQCASCEHDFHLDRDVTVTFTTRRIEGVKP